MHHRVLIISASMGAGHDGAARELARRLEDDGHRVVVKDFLQAPPRPVGWILRSSYAFQLRYMAWTYELMYRVWFLLPLLVGPLARFASLLSRRRLRAWAVECDADVIVSTYPLASQALAAMRRKGRLSLPVATFLTDFGIHPLWVNAGIDLHLAVHPDAAADAARRTGGPARAPGPLVPGRFRAAAAGGDRDRMRAALDLEPADRAVLVVAGSWGVGAVARTFRILATSSEFVPIAVCGRDERLRRRLQRVADDGRLRGRVLGWTDDMPGLMAAADVLVENAGGLTAMEAFSSGLPVVTFLPIPGHGRENARRMAAAGVTTWARSPEELLVALRALSWPGPVRNRQVAAAEAMLAGDAAVDVVRFADAAASAGRRPVPVRVSEGAAAAAGRLAASGRTGFAPRAVRIATRAAALSAVLSVATVGANAAFTVATAYGVGTAHPRGPSAREAAFVAVRLDPAEAADPRVADALARMGATAILDGPTAEATAAGLRTLVERGVDVESGGAGRHTGLPWRRSQLDVVAARRELERLSGRPVKVFVPARHVDGLDLLWLHTTHARVVVPNRIVPGADTDESSSVRARRVYVVAGAGATPDQLLDTLAAIQRHLDDLGLHAAPLSQLR